MRVFQSSVRCGASKGLFGPRESPRIRWPKATTRAKWPQGRRIRFWPANGTPSWCIWPPSRKPQRPDPLANRRRVGL